MHNPAMEFDAQGEAVRRLVGEFAGRFERRTVRAVVDGSCDDLTGVPAGALPELLERLARQRLLDLHN
jgi:hypothetical protein